MADVIVGLAQEHSTKSQGEVLSLLDEEVARFSSFMAQLGDSRAQGPLNNPEKALVKTYLVAKLRGKI